MQNQNINQQFRGEFEEEALFHNDTKKPFLFWPIRHNLSTNWAEITFTLPAPSPCHI